MLKTITSNIFGWHCRLRRKRGKSHLEKNAIRFFTQFFYRFVFSFIIIFNYIFCCLYFSAVLLCAFVIFLFICYFYIATQDEYLSILFFILVKFCNPLFLILLLLFLCLKFLFSLFFKQ